MNNASAESTQLQAAQNSEVDNDIAFNAASSSAVTVRTRKGGAVRRTTIYLDHDAYRRLRLFCAENDRDLSAVVNEALSRYLQEKA